MKLKISLELDLIRLRMAADDGRTVPAQCRTVRVTVRNDLHVPSHEKLFGINQIDYITLYSGHNPGALSPCQSYRPNILIGNDFQDDF